MPPQTSVIEFPSLKRTRRYGAKSKTGCITCKIRRVRCDEQKPFCLKCTSTGRKCDGYAQDKVGGSNALGLNHGSILGHTTPTLWNSGDSVHYLEFYHHCAGRTLSSKFDNGFWSRIVLQMAQSETSVRHALIALGYLNKTEPGSLKHARSIFAAEHRKTLLFHYNKAVRCLVDRMAEASYAPEVGLVTCLLFICIEFLRGNYHTAFTHLDSGLKIISEWQNDSFKGLLTGSPPLQSSSAISRGTLGSGTMIEDHLIPIFVRTITPALMYGVSIEKIFEIPTPRPEIFHEQPFMTLFEAQSSIHDLRNASVLFARTMAQKLIVGVPATITDLQTQARLLEGHHTWFRALQLFERERRLSKEDSVIASAIKIGYYSTYTALAAATEVRQTQYDAHFASFKALLYHAKIVLGSMNLLNSPTSSSPTGRNRSKSPATADAISSSSSHSPPRPAANFTFEISLIPCLHHTATRCRCPVTRREAVSLLELKPPREALWDAEVLIAVAKRVIEIEEREVDPETGWPVERSRLWSAVADGNMDRNGGFWVFFALADWVKGKGGLRNSAMRRSDAQWEEWFVV